MEGRYVILEKLDAQNHCEALFRASTQDDAELRFKYLFEEVPTNYDQFKDWFDGAERSNDPFFYAVIDKNTGKVSGRQTLMRIDQKNGVIETGSIFWNKDISKTPVTTEAFYLFAKHVFEDLGYRRFEWKCNNLNESSKKAALRYGMKHEGLFRQHMIVKGQNRDTAWFAMLDSEWPLLKKAFEVWLSPENFDEHGQQKTTLAEQREGIGSV